MADRKRTKIEPQSTNPALGTSVKHLSSGSARKKIKRDASEQADTSNQTCDKNVFPIMKLPRELRDRIYDFHLEVSCEKSQFHDWKDYTSVGSKSQPIASETRPGFFYEPVFIRILGEADSSTYVPPHWGTVVTFQARAYPLPMLAQLKGTRVAEEAWSGYVSRLVVHTDALNRFHRWCEETLDRKKFLSLRKLHVVTRATFHLTGASAKLEKEGEPVFVIQISEDRKAITLSSRFPLQTSAHAILIANLKTLTAHRSVKQNLFDGTDIIDVMFSLHNTRMEGRRRDLVIGPYRKSMVTWPFLVEEAGLQSLYAREEDALVAMEDVLSRVKRFRHVIYHAEVKAK
jgi:hypothetical protein